MAKTKTKRVAPGIKRIIDFLQRHLEDRNSSDHYRTPLCSTGKKRLDWWKKNKYKFSSAKAAMLTWDYDAVTAWLEYAGIDYDDPNEDQQNASYDLSDFIYDHKYALTIFHVEVLKNVIRSLDTSTTIKGLLKPISESKLSTPTWTL